MSGFWGHGGPYEEWVTFLRSWAAFEPVDPARLPAIEAETYDGDTVARLADHLSEAVSTRLQAWADTLVRAMDAATDEFSAGRELAQARTGLRAIRDVAGHRGLPERLRERLTEMVDRQIPELQAQLERLLEQAARDEPEARWVEERRRTLRDNALTAVLSQPASAPGSGTADAWSYDPAATPRRRILRD
ncbi:hypothetical protein M5362_20725 [Streptomyces sp. Je 1-79]|uniref:hypothetical protein n=1 Tax=Streptomyces sp. Je 1-79 TaxID=2943847 RepID=UPI0021A44C75|nr:hypothetical protein [Streptomyces sp. Je 1-79]MCT4355565.1 hypothetical protein [Streptomyces sp. Je 1-79]